MVKLCIENNCLTRPSYNYKGELNAVYCAKHKKETMINVIHKKCNELYCNIRPSFNYE